MVVTCTYMLVLEIFVNFPLFKISAYSFIAIFCHSLVTHDDERIVFTNHLGSFYIALSVLPSEKFWHWLITAMSFKHFECIPGRLPVHVQYFMASKRINMEMSLPIIRLIIEGTWVYSEAAAKNMPSLWAGLAGNCMCMYDDTVPLAWVHICEGLTQHAAQCTCTLNAYDAVRCIRRCLVMIQHSTE